MYVFAAAPERPRTQTRQKKGWRLLQAMSAAQTGAMLLVMVVAMIMSNVGTAIASNENNHHNATQLTCNTAARARCCERDARFEPATENSMALSTAHIVAHRCHLWHSSNEHRALPVKVFLRCGQARVSQQRSREGGAHSGTQHEHALLLLQQA